MLLQKILPQWIIKWTEYPYIYDSMKTYLDKSAQIVAEWLPQTTLWERGTSETQSWSSRQSVMSGRWQAEMLGSVHTQPQTDTGQAGSAMFAKNNSDGSGKKALGTHFLQLFFLATHAKV